MACDQTTLSLQIQDNGQGMSLPDNGRASSGPIRAGVGIQGMRERVKQLGGQFEIQSTGKGTTVTVKFPLTQPTPNSFPEAKPAIATPNGSVV